MNRYVLSVCAMVCVFPLVQVANADTVDVHLSLDFVDTGDAGSGGTWTVSALADEMGLAGIVFDIEPADFTGNFLISNTIFEVQNYLALGSGLGFELVTGDDLATPTYNVGVGSYVGLATGTFDPGDVPALTDFDANVFLDMTPTVVDAITSTSLTTNLVPEPSTLLLGAMSTVGLLMRRRR
jgi:hypothetical protein